MIKERQKTFEDNIPMDKKAKFGLEENNMIKLMMVIYTSLYDTDFTKLDSFLLKFLDDFDDELKLNNIKSWYFQQDRGNYLLFLEHCLKNGLNPKKVIK